MHQKKSEVQIGKESSGVSSDFNPTPPLLFPPPSSVHHKHLSSPHYPSYLSQQSFHLYHPLSSSSSPLPPQLHQKTDLIAPPSPSSSSNSSSSTPYKRPLLNQTHHSSSLSKSPTLFRFPSQPPPPQPHPHQQFNSHKNPSLFSISISVKAFLYRTLRRIKHFRRLRVHLRLILLLSLPFFYFLVSHPSHSFFLDFLSAFAFSAALLFSLNLALPRLPSIRLFLTRALPIKLCRASHISRPPLPVFWSIGSRPKPEKRANSGCWVQIYRNGDVYEGEFHKGKCSGSGVYYYYMSGRYEGDWVDGKYDGYGVETWARGSRYRGQYRQGLRHGFGVYRFYTGDVYGGEWASGQSHGCGVHTCEDGSRYVGEFKWGVKHGLGHYHFR